jgi:hypothetical protein
VRAQDLNKRLAALEIELAEEKNVKKVAEYQSKSVIAELTAEFEVQRSELTRILREKDVLHEKVRDLETKYDTDKKQSTTYRKETTGTIATLERTVREMKMRIADYEAKIIVAKSTELDSQFAAQMLKASAESLKAEQTAAVEALKRESYLKVTDLEKTYVDKLERIKENTREALEKVFLPSEFKVFLPLISSFHLKYIPYFCSGTKAGRWLQGESTRCAEEREGALGNCFSRGS